MTTENFKLVLEGIKHHFKLDCNKPQACLNLLVQSVQKMVDSRLNTEAEASPMSQVAIPLFSA